MAEGKCGFTVGAQEAVQCGITSGAQERGSVESQQAPWGRWQMAGKCGHSQTQKSAGPLRQGGRGRTCRYPQR